MSRFLDERGRIFGKVSIVDLLVLLVIVAVVAFAVVRMTGSTSSQTVPVTVTYTVTEVRQATVNMLVHAAETAGYVRDDGGTKLGEVVSVEATPALKEGFTPDGELKAFESLVFSDVNVVVEGEAQLVNSALRIGSVEMGVGKKLTLVGTGFETQAVIMGVVWDQGAVK